MALVKIWAGLITASSTDVSYPLNKIATTTADFWATASDQWQNQWVTFEFGRAYQITRYSMTARTGSQTQSPGTFSLKGSNTGAFSGEETTLDSQSSITWSSGETKNFDFSNSSSFKYYKLVIDTNQLGSDRVSLVALEMFEDDTADRPYSSFTKDVSGTPTANSEFSGDYSAAKAIDGNTGTYWVTAGGTPAWWQMQYAAQTQINKLIFKSRPSLPTQAILSGTITASNTGAFGGEEVTLLQVSNNGEWADSEVRFWEFANASSYYYYRINITEIDGGGNVSAAEIELYIGSNPSTTPAPTTFGATTIAPTTLPPTTLAPTTPSPTTLPPTTLAPTTLPPTASPTTLSPTTPTPTTLAPTTIAPTTVPPTTVPPTTVTPTTLAPTTITTTLAPTTIVTTLAPTTAVPLPYICVRPLISNITDVLELHSPITKELEIDGNLCR